MLFLLIFPILLTCFLSTATPLPFTSQAIRRGFLEELPHLSSLLPDVLSEGLRDVSELNQSGGTVSSHSYSISGYPGSVGKGGNNGLLAGGLLVHSENVDASKSSGLLTEPKERYIWTAPMGWTRPSWYEFGFYHPITGRWVNSQVQVLAFLKKLSFQSLSIQNPYPLFPLSPGYSPLRDTEWSRRGRLGFFDQADRFIDLEVDIAVSILLGSCGYSRV